MKTKLLLFMALLSSAIGLSQTITTVTGSSAGDAVGNAATARFNYPSGITNDGGNVYVTDSGNHKIKKILSDNSTVSFVGSTQGFVNGTGAAARFDNPTGIVRIAFNDFLVCDNSNNAIRKVTSAGLVTTFAGGTLGNADGTGTSAQFSSPFGIAIDASDNAYVTDYNNKRIRKITPAGVVTTLAGSTSGFTDGTGAAAQFFSPTFIAVDASGNVFVADGNTIRKITPSGVVTTFAGANTTGNYLDGNGTAARFNGIQGLSFDGAGNLIVLDTFNYRIRKISPSGNVTTFAGTGVSGNIDGDAATATFFSVTGITKMMTTENLYLTDQNSHRIRKITPASPATAPTITGVSSSSITSYSANIGYTLNANNAATTSVINYGLSSGALTSQISGFSASGSTALSSAIMISGLSASTIYYYQIVATNSAGSTLSTTGSFTTTAAAVAGTAIAEYNFNNTYNNINGNTPFGSNTGTSFVTGRDGVTVNGALNINNTGSTATIPGLPYGNTARTISLWVKTNVMNSSNYNMVFSYGQISNSNAIGASYNASICEMFGYANNLFIASTNANNTWYHFVYVYDGANAKIYKNGVLLTTQSRTWNTINSSNIFKLGIGVGNEYYFNGAIDDLKIYGSALTDTEVTSLFNNNTLSSSNFQTNNLKLNLYPNPATDILNISLETELKSIEIYSLSGQKVLSSDKNQVDVSNLSKGMYMVRVEDVEGLVSTQKLIVE